MRIFACTTFKIVFEMDVYLRYSNFTKSYRIIPIPISIFHKHHWYRAAVTRQKFASVAFPMHFKSEIISLTVRKNKAVFVLYFRKFKSKSFAGNFELLYKSSAFRHGSYVNSRHGGSDRKTDRIENVSYRVSQQPYRRNYRSRNNRKTEHRDIKCVLRLRYN